MFPLLHEGLLVTISAFVIAFKVVCDNTYLKQVLGHHQSRYVPTQGNQLSGA